MLIELARYPEAADLLRRNIPRVLPGLGTIHLYSTLAHLAIRTGDLPTARRDLATAENEAGSIADAQFVIDLCSFATEIALWSGDPAGALAIAQDGFERLAEMDDAVILGQLAIPAVRAAADLAVAARAGRDQASAASAVDSAGDIIERYRASTGRLTEPDALARHEIAWRMDLCAAELARANGDDSPGALDGPSTRSPGTTQPVPRGVCALARGRGARRSGRSRVGRWSVARCVRPRPDASGRPCSIERIDGLARRLRIDVVPQDVAGPRPSRRYPSRWQSTRRLIRSA